MIERRSNQSWMKINCCQCLASWYTALDPWPRARIKFFRQRLIDQTMMYFQTRSKDERNLTKIEFWWRTSYNWDGVATHETIKEIISHFKNHRSIKIIKSHISLDDQKFSLKLATGNSIKKIIDKLGTRTSTPFDSIPPKLSLRKSTMLPLEKCHRFWLRLRHAVILISNDRTLAFKKRMGLIRTLTILTTAFEGMKEKFCGFRQIELVKLA